MFIIPPKLKTGDEVRVLTLSKSLGLISLYQSRESQCKLEKLGLKVSFGSNAIDVDEFESNSISKRIEDLHEAILDPNVKMIMAAKGGYNLNQILPFIDFELIQNNPKIFIGYSDITALLNAITAKTNLVTYLGPNFSGFYKLELHNEDYTFKGFYRNVFENNSLEIKPANTITDFSWTTNTTDIYNSDGFWNIQPGEASGKILGGNLCTFNLLQGTEFMPNLANSILFIEDDCENNLRMFDRNLESLTQQPNFEKVQGLVLGVLQKASKIDKESLTKILANKPKLKGLPIIGNVNFGHTFPMLTIPIGANCSFEAADRVKLVTQA